MKNKGCVKNELCYTIRTNTFAPNEYQKFVKNYFFDNRLRYRLFRNKYKSRHINKFKFITLFLTTK